MAAMDVEWSKNYRVRDGNVPFCYSVAWLALPASGASLGLDAARFWYASVYVENTSERPDLVASADAALACLMGHASLIAGHQLCSDLAILAAGAAVQPPAVAAAAAAWRQRRQETSGQPRFLDTRYDAGRILRGAAAGWSTCAPSWAWTSPSPNCPDLDDRAAPALAGLR